MLEAAIPWQILGVLIILALLIVLATGLPIAFSLALLSFAFLFFTIGVKSTVVQAAIVSFNMMNEMVLVAVPLFIFMAEIIMFSGVSRDLFDFANKWLGRFPGGLAQASNGAAGVFAAVCGASVATAATVGLIAIPEMMEKGYDKRLAVGAVAAGGSIGILIPPSIPMILYCFVTEQSVGQMFMAGFIPGVISVFVYFSGIAIRCIRNPKLAPKGPPVSWGTRIASLRKVWSTLVLILAVMGSIYLGVATPTEAAAVGAFGAILLAIIYSRLNWQNMKSAMLRAIQTNCFIMLIVISASLFGYLLSYLRIPQQLTEALLTLGVNRWLIMFMIMVILLIMGMFLEIASIIFLTMPIIYPVVAGLGFDPIWFGIVLVINMEMAVITPPVGLNLYVIRGIAEPYGVTLGDVIRGILPFLPLDLIRMGIMLAFPPLSLWLPSKMITIGR